ncbi:hypothetical protein, partial [Xylella fastidiosa]|uniref:hypothetical protein n=1 Tax=Xylella fastidiosa TaxID=2371 RepID=UPI0004DD42D2
RNPQKKRWIETFQNSDYFYNGWKLFKKRITYSAAVRNKECSQEAQCLACVGDGWLQAQLKLPGHDTMEVAERALQK